MLRRTSDGLCEDLLQAPESGMGYQIAVVHNDRYLILNAVLAVPLVGPRVYLLHEAPERVTIASRARILLEGDKLHLADWRDSATDWLSPDGYGSLNRMAEAWMGEEDPMAAIAKLPTLEGLLEKVETHGSYLAPSRPGELFVRYSAFPDDRRINPDGSAKLGTYVTTDLDAKLVPSGLSAVGRYALPFPAPAVHRFLFSPPPGTTLRCGTVAPDFGRAGGGVEVLFDSALPPGTAHGPHPIPER